MLRQVVRRGGGATAAQVGTAGHQHRAGGEQRPGHVRVGRCGGVADGKVETFGGKRTEAVREFEFEPHLGMGAQELRDARDQLLAREGHRCGHAHAPGRQFGEVAPAGEALRDALERFAHAIHQLLPGFGEAHAACGALHQRHAGSPLQLADALAHGGLAHAQPLRGGGVAALLREHGEPVQVHPEGFHFFGIHASIVHHIEQSVQVCALCVKDGSA
ncbi:hypothetical protein FQZ97_772060 [compost metagenome]